MAYREYEVPLASGGKASLAFTLGRSGIDTVPAKLAKQQNARAYGLVSILDYTDAPQYPMVWLQTDTQLGIVVADEDKEMSEDLRQIVGRYLMSFFNDIAEIEPQLAALKIKPDVGRDRTLN